MKHDRGHSLSPVLPGFELVARAFSPTVRLEIGTALPFARSTFVFAVKLLPPTRHDPPSSVTSSVASAAASTATSVVASAARRKRPRTPLTQSDDPVSCGTTETASADRPGPSHQSHAVTLRCRL